MYKQPLLSGRYSMVGYLLFIPAAIAHLFFSGYNDEKAWSMKFPVIVYDNFFQSQHFIDVVNVPVFNTVVGLFALTGLFFIAFSKVKEEDEYTQALRLNSWLWSVLINCALLFLCFLFIYGLSFLYVMLYNMYSLLIIFIIRFKFLLYKSTKIASE